MAMSKYVAEIYELETHEHGVTNANVYEDIYRLQNQ